MSASPLTTGSAYGLYQLSEKAYSEAVKASERLATGVRVASPADDTTRFSLQQNLSSLATASEILAEGNETNKQSLDITNGALRELYETVKSMKVPASKALGAAPKQAEMLQTFINYSRAKIENIIKNTTGIDGGKMLDGTRDFSNLKTDANFVTLGRCESTIERTMGTTDAQTANTISDIFTVNDLYFVTGEKGVTSTGPITKTHEIPKIVMTFKDLSGTTTNIDNFLTIQGVNISVDAAAAAGSITPGAIRLKKGDVSAMAADFVTQFNSYKATYDELDYFTVSINSGAITITNTKTIGTDPAVGNYIIHKSSDTNALNSIVKSTTSGNTTAITTGSNLIETLTTSTVSAISTNSVTKYGGRYVAEDVKIDLSNLVAGTDVANFIKINGVNISTGNAAAAAAQSITIVDTSPAAAATSLVAQITAYQALGGSSTELKGFSATAEGNVVTLKRSSAINSNEFLSREDVAYSVEMGTTSDQVLSSVKVGSEDYTVQMLNLTGSETLKTTARGDKDFSYGTIAQTVELNMLSTGTNTAGDLFSITYKDASGTDVTTSFSLAATESLTTTDSPVLATSADGSTVAKRICDIINGEVTSSSMSMAGFRAKSDGEKIYISRYDSNGSESYNLLVKANAAPAIGDVKINGTKYGSQQTTGNTSLKVTAEHKEVVMISADNVFNLMNTVSEFINVSGQNTFLSPKSQESLAPLTASIDTTKFNSSSTYVTMGIQSSVKGFAGQIYMQNQLSNGVTEVGNFGDTRVGSLGVSSVSVTGAPLGTNSYFKWNQNFSAPSTDWFDVDVSKIVEGGTFTVGAGYGAKKYTFSTTPSPNSEQEIQIAGANIDGTYKIDYKKTLANLVNSLRSNTDVVVSGLDYQIREYVDATDQVSSIQMKVSGRTASSSMNGLGVYFSSGISDLEVQSESLKGGISSGIDTSNIQNNSGFTGILDDSMIEANYKGQSTVSMVIRSPKDPNIYYRADNVYTAPINDTVVRFSSADNGYIDVTFAGEKGVVVQNQTDANAYAVNFAKSLSGISFSQTRNIESYKPESGSSLLVDSYAKYTSDNFMENMKISSVSIKGTQDDPSVSNKSYITINVEGVGAFTNYIEDDKSLQAINAGQEIDLFLNGDTNSSQKITLYIGRDIDLTDGTICQNLQDELQGAFQTGSGPLTFYMSPNDLTDTSSIFFVSIPDISPTATFNVTSEQEAIKTLAAMEDYEAHVLEIWSRLGQSQKQVESINELLNSSSEALAQAGKVMVNDNPGQSLQQLIRSRQEAETAVQMFSNALQQQNAMIKQLIRAAAM